jgi:hypothetical protein
MSRRNQRRAAIMNRVNRFYDVRRIMKEGNYSARQMADILLSLESKLAEILFGGKAHFTGNNRVFANGAIAYEVLCRECKKPFWVTTMPSAVCADCER